MSNTYEVIIDDGMMEIHMPRTNAAGALAVALELVERSNAVAEALLATYGVRDEADEHYRESRAADRLLDVVSRVSAAGQMAEALAEVLRLVPAGTSDDALSTYSGMTWIRLQNAARIIEAAALNSI